jgi:hypothetical protein
MMELIQLEHEKKNTKGRIRREREGAYEARYLNIDPKREAEIPRSYLSLIG